MSYLPIIQRFKAQLSKTELEQANQLADDLCQREPRLSANRYFEPHVRTGLTEGNRVLFGDTSEIPHTRDAVTGYLEYRLSVLASDGDMSVIRAGRDRGFEDYLKRVLGAPDLTFTAVGSLLDDDDMPSPVACLKDDKCFNLVAGYSMQRQQITLLPHISTGAVWALARRLCTESGVTVHVAGPPPEISKRVNDKIWFAAIVKQLFGEHSVPPEHAVFGLAALVSRVAEYAQCSERIVIKVPNSTGSQGNFPVLSQKVRNLRSRELASRLSSMFRESGWDIGYPLMVQAWDESVLSSPSVQMWIPHQADGHPVIDGVFEQNTAGPAGQFQGALSATLPKVLMRQLVDKATLLAIVFQRLGYYGRCSIDTVLAGADMSSASFHWIECNGRWGGVSVPMTLADRLLPEASDLEIAIIQRRGLSNEPRDFSEVLDRFSRLLWFPGKKSGIVITSPRRFTEGTGADFVAIETTREAAVSLAEDAVSVLA